MNCQTNGEQWLWSFLLFWLILTSFGIWSLWWFFPMLWWIILYSVWANPMRELQMRKAKSRRAWNDNRTHDHYRYDDDHLADDEDLARQQRLRQPETPYQTIETPDGEVLRVIDDDGKMPPRLHIG